MFLSLLLLLLLLLLVECWRIVSAVVVVAVGVWRQDSCGDFGRCLCADDDD